MAIDTALEIVAKIEHKRLARLIRICNELSDRMMFARSLAAYALEMKRVDLYFQRLGEYAMVERQLVIYRYLIGCEWRRIAGIRPRTLPPVIDSVVDVARWT